MRFIIGLFEVVSNGLSLLAGAVVVAIAGTLLALAVFSPAPGERPAMDNIAWSEDAGLGDRAVATGVVAIADWEVTDLKFISFAEGEVPLTGEKLEMVGIDGKWYFGE